MSKVAKFSGLTFFFSRTIVILIERQSNDYVNKPYLLDTYNRLYGPDQIIF